MPSKKNTHKANKYEVALPFGGRTAGDPERQPVPAKRERTKEDLRRLLWSTPLIVVASLIASFLVGLPVWSHHTRGQWQAGEYTQATGEYSTQRTLTTYGPESWVAHYNVGTSLLKDGKAGKALSELQIALEGVPKATQDEEGHIQVFSYECQVRINTALAFEVLGDQAMESGNGDEADQNYQQADETLVACTLDSRPQDPSDPQDQSSGGQGGQGGDQGQSGDSDQSSSSQSGLSSDNEADRQGEDSEPDQGSSDGSANQEESSQSEQASKARERLKNKRQRAQGKPDKSNNSQRSDSSGQRSSGGGQEQSQQGDSSDQEGDEETKPKTAEEQRRREIERRLRRSTDVDEDSSATTRTGDSNGAW